MVHQPFNSSIINWNPSSHLWNLFDVGLRKTGPASVDISWEPSDASTDLVPLPPASAPVKDPL